MSPAALSLSARTLLACGQQVLGSCSDSMGFLRFALASKSGVEQSLLSAGSLSSSGAADWLEGQALAVRGSWPPRPDSSLRSRLKKKSARHTPSLVESIALTATCSCS